ncbi:predicted protein [Nematostella vectensis]|uniref:Aromatic-L-amino-acid decarboxylase n=1 Tax=Nematostella vectensis TaxID=45351 RepID=A7RYR9_NEMVE|nr:predicted protein [Nematostella vectensis]|eukprot:XP_001635474.1 predicted protein [Nematostella vectensis]
MNSEEFRKHGKAMIDFIADFLETIEKRRVVPDVKPGFLLHQLPNEAPSQSENFDAIFEDFEKKVLPGVTLWGSPHFHAFFPSSISYPGILGELMSASLAGVGFNWLCNPSSTELEIMVLDWLGKMLDLPKEFLAMTPAREDGRRGGGVIQGTASEATLVAVLAARTATLTQLQNEHPGVAEGVLMSKMVAYTSKHAHSSVEKAARIAGVKLRSVETDDAGSLRGEQFLECLKADKEAGLIPFFLCATLGTTTLCSYDNLKELGPLAVKEKMWLHVDAAYAGPAFTCPEMRAPMQGIELADSFNCNAHKMMMTNFDCAPMWVKDRDALMRAFTLERIYYPDDDTGVVTEFRNWQIPLGRRFRSLKLWFVIRSYGIEGIQKEIREHVRLAKVFEEMVKQDDDFELVVDTNFGLVCFRYKGSEEDNKNLVDILNAEGKILVTPGIHKGRRNSGCCLGD